MAAIDVYLQEILDAVYGEEVRGAIHDAIQQVYTDGHTGVPTTRTINGHPLTNDITLTASDVGAVAKTGDTMTGALRSTHVISYGTDKYPRFIFNLHDNSGAAGWLLMNTDTRGISFRSYMSDLVHYDSFALPAPSDLSRTTDVGYSVLTTKSAVTVAQGGTGATTAANARTNLGAVSKTGDTMTGSLKATELRVKGTDNMPKLVLEKSNGDTVTWFTTDTDANRTRIYHFKSGGGYDVYQFPVLTSGTDSNSYGILTTKNAVAVAEGGTGATTAANARTNLGITPANIGAVPTTRKVNNKALSADITLSASDVGAIATTGGTMTGVLFVTSTNGYPTIGFTRPNGNRGVWVQPTVTNDATTHMSFIQYNSDATYYENYALPNTSTSLAANATYSVLTSKSAVTVAQGGTGATTAANARANLGLTYKAGDSITGAFCITGRIVNAGTGVYGVLTLDKTITATSASFSDIGSVNIYTTDGAKTLTTFTFVKIAQNQIYVTASFSGSTVTAGTWGHVEINSMRITFA